MIQQGLLNTQGVCPHCGYCPHCGRSNNHPHIQQPFIGTVNPFGQTIGGLQSHSNAEFQGNLGGIGVLQGGNS